MRIQLRDDETAILMPTEIANCTEMGSRLPIQRDANRQTLIIQ
jgi:hypothetical protein